MTDFGLEGFAGRLPYAGARPESENGAAPYATHEGDHTPAGVDTSSMLSSTAAAGDALRPVGPTGVEMAPLRQRHRNRLLGFAGIAAALAAIGALAWPAVAGNRGGGNSEGGAVTAGTTAPPSTEASPTLPAYNLDDRCPDPTATEPQTKAFGERVKPPKYFPGDLGAKLIDGAGTNGLSFQEAVSQAYARRLGAVEQKLNWVAGFTDREKAEKELQTILGGEGNGEDNYRPYEGLTNVVLACVFNRSMEPDRDYRFRLSLPDANGVVRGKDDGLLASGLVLDVYSMEGDKGTLAASYGIEYLELGSANKDGTHALTVNTTYGLGKPLVVERRD
jgi:hypothetical protein